jgi:ribosomal protein S18 acetylase RimI-like enzyme
MDRRAIVAAIETNFSDQAWSLRALPDAEVYEDEYVRWAITGVGFPALNAVTRTVIPIDSADRIIGETLARFRAHDVPMLWLVAPSSEPVDLAQRLEAHGLLCAERVPGMALDLSDGREPAPQPPGDVRQVRTESQLDDFMDVFAMGFGLSEAAIAGFAQVFRGPAREHYRQYVAYAGERAVAVASVFCESGVAGIYNVTTVPHARRKGHGSAVIDAALRDARAQHAHLAILGSSDEGQGMYRRLGFEQYCTIGMYTG